MRAKSRFHHALLVCLLVPVPLIVLLSTLPPPLDTAFVHSMTTLQGSRLQPLIVLALLLAGLWAIPTPRLNGPRATLAGFVVLQLLASFLHALLAPLPASHFPVLRELLPAMLLPTASLSLVLFVLLMERVSTSRPLS